MPLVAVARAALVVMAVLLSLSSLSEDAFARLPLAEPKTPADLGLAKGAKVVADTLEGLGRATLWSGQVQEPAFWDGKLISLKKYLQQLSESLSKLSKRTDLDFSQTNRQTISTLAQKLMIMSYYNRFKTPAELTRQLSLIVTEIRERLVPSEMPQLKGSSGFLKSSATKLAEEEVRLKQHDGALAALSVANLGAITGLKIEIPPRLQHLDTPEKTFQHFARGSQSESLDPSHIDSFWDGVDSFIEDYVDHHLGSRQQVFKEFMIEDSRLTYNREVVKYIEHFETTKPQQNMIKSGDIEGIDILVVADGETTASRLKALASPLGLCDLILRATRVEQVLRLPRSRSVTDR